MDVLITILFICALLVCLGIMCDYMHNCAGMPYKRIAAITFPIWLMLVVMLFLSIFYKA